MEDTIMTTLMNTNHNLEELALEIIIFLQKWGLWKDTSIFTKGNKYAYDKNKTYKDIQNVEFTANVNTEDYTKGLTNIMDCNGNREWKSYANPEHLFDMVYDGILFLPIYMVEML